MLTNALDLTFESACSENQIKLVQKVLISRQSESEAPDSQVEIYHLAASEQLCLFLSCYWGTSKADGNQRYRCLGELIKYIIMKP